MKQHKYEIESGIEIPRPKTRVKKIWKKYPFSDMGVGDSFLISYLKTHKNFRSQIQLVREAASQYCRRNGFKFTTRKIDEHNARCWRIE